MKEATGEANMTVVTIILIAVIVAVATPIINTMMTTTEKKSCCMNDGGTWDASKKACDNGQTYDKGCSKAGTTGGAGTAKS